MAEVLGHEVAGGDIGTSKCITVNRTSVTRTSVMRTSPDEGMPIPALFALLLGGHQPFTYITHRMIDVGIGVATGLAVNVLVFPRCSSARPSTRSGSGQRRRPVPMRNAAQHLARLTGE